MRYKSPWTEEEKMSLAISRYGHLAEFVSNFRKTHGGALPWKKSFHNAQARCENKNEPKYAYYGGKGIRCFLTMEDVKDIYYRDQAWLMKIPSLDRIDSDKHYTLGNCQFIEFDKNRTKRKYK